MDDQQRPTPVTDFLYSLQAKTAVATKQKEPVATEAETVAVAEGGAAPTKHDNVIVIGSVMQNPATIEVTTMVASELESRAEGSVSSSEAVAKESADVGEDAKALDTTDPQDSRVIHANKIRIITRALRAMERNIANVIRLLEEDGPGASSAAYESSEPVDLSMLRAAELAGIRQVDGRVVEGVFDGQSMVGSDGKIYTVPPNYASKSKLVEGDLLKLTITPRGSFIYKQIGPIDRSRIVAALGFDATSGEYYATHEDKRWSVIKASVTYFKGEPEDEVVILVPQNTPSRWAAVENVIKQTVVI